MANRNLLPKHRLEEFKAWLTARGIAHRPGRGTFEVLQVQLQPPVWHVIFRKLTRNPHYTVPNPLVSLTEQFIYERKHGNHHPASGQQARTEDQRPDNDSRARNGPDRDSAPWE